MSIHSPAEPGSEILKRANYALSNLATSVLTPLFAVRHAKAIQGVECFCAFIGHPRSGHSLVGAMLNAHPRAVIAHEAKVARFLGMEKDRSFIFSQILARAYWFHLRRNKGVYDYAIPGGAQGRISSPGVVGDKCAGYTTRMLSQSGAMEKVRSIVGVPVRMIQIVRNPFDNIATISRFRRVTLAQAADRYFTNCEGVKIIRAQCNGDEVFLARHEEIVRDPKGQLSVLCEHIGLTAEADYLAACASVVFRPRPSRSRVDWPDELIASIEERAARYPFLGVCRFHD